VSGSYGGQVSWLVGWLGGWVVGWLVRWFVGWLVRWCRSSHPSCVAIFVSFFLRLVAWSWSRRVGGVLVGCWVLRQYLVFTERCR